MFKKKTKKTTSKAPAGIGDGLAEILPPVHAFDLTLGESNIDCLTENLGKLYIGTVVERCVDKAGVDHYNVTAHFTTAGDVSLQSSTRIDEHATPEECEQAFQKLVRDLLP